jgi:nucleoside-diphosphate-sugar epimerase
MRVFMTGATGFVGTEVVHELINSGHKVLGLARSKEAVAALAAIRADVHSGSLENLDSLRSGADASDAVIHLGFNNEFSKFRENSEIERRAIEAIGSAMIGSDKPLIVTNGIAGFELSGQVIAEHDDIPKNYRFPRAAEQTALRLASQGVLASVIRLAQVHNTVKQGLVTRLIEVARSKGASAYVNGGLNRWPAVHVSDVARLFRLVTEASEAGAKYHAVAEEGVEMRVIAGVISRILSVPVKSLTAEEARDHFGPLSMFVGEDMPASAIATRKKMRWHPTGPTLITDLEQIGYSASARADSDHH